MNFLLHLKSRGRLLAALAIVAAVTACQASAAAQPSGKNDRSAATARVESAFASSPLGEVSKKAADLHLIVGRSIFLNSGSRLRKVYVSNPKVLQSFTADPHEVVITAIAPGVSSLALWDAAGHSKLYTVSADIDVAGLRRSIAQLLPGEGVHVRAQEGRVYLSGSVRGSSAYKQVSALAAVYSHNVVNSLSTIYVHPRQVRLKVRMVEVDRTKLKQFGLNFYSNGSKMSTVSTQQFRSVGLTQSGNGGQAEIGLSDPLNLFFYDSHLNVGATLSNFASHDVLQILAEPTITTVSGHEAQFLSGGEFPYPVIQGGAGNFASVTIMFQPYGVKLQFTPTVNPDGTILLKVAPEVSALDYSNAVTISGYTIPAISTRRAETEVELRSGQSFSISGLLDRRTTVLLSKMPGIGDIPILGQLFRSKNDTHSVSDLVVIVTAKLVDPLHQPTHPKAPKMAVPNMKVGAFDREIHSGSTPDPE